MNAPRRLSLAAWWSVLTMIGGLGPVDATAQALRAWLGASSRSEMDILGIDEAGIRMRPTGSTVGEIILPLAEARELFFILPEFYQRAQQLAFHARPDEALALLGPVINPMLPFLAAPGTNAVPATNFYFDLLLGQQRWDEALGLARQLPLEVQNTGFLPRVVELARALRATGRAMEATILAARIPVTAKTMEWFPLLANFADELRRAGNYTEAQMLYQRLRPFDTGEAQVERMLMIAYTDFHTGRPLQAGALWEQLPAPVATSDESYRTLYLLLSGRIALDAGRATDALDQLSRGLVEANGVSEWRAELLAATALAYRAVGDPEIASLIEEDLRRIYPGSRWSPRAPVPAATAN
jgi:tetratricopeptide (TPR) repeat protein